MEFKAFSFEQNSHAFAQLKRSVADAVDNTAVYFESYSDSKQLFSDIGDALEYADVLLIGIEPKAYLKFKPVLIKAFNFTPAYSDKIMDAIENSVSDETVRKAHALIPNEAEELMTEINELVCDILERCYINNVRDWNTIKTRIKDGVARFLFSKTKRSPMILPVIMEV